MHVYLYCAHFKELIHHIRWVEVIKCPLNFIKSSYLEGFDCPVYLTNVDIDYDIQKRLFNFGNATREGWIKRVSRWGELKSLK